MRTEDQAKARASLEDVLARVDQLQTQTAYLVQRQRQQEELFEELGPVLKEVLRTATTRLDALEKEGYFAFGRELVGVARRVVEGFDADDVRKLGNAIVTILETVRAATQPELMAIAGEAAEVVQNAGSVEPMGILGMVRSSRHEDVQRGMAVMMELLKHLGRAADTMARQRDTSPAARKRARLAELTGARTRNKTLGVERAPAARAVAQAPGKPEPGLGPPAACAVPSTKLAAVATVIDGVGFTADGHLADPAAWSRELAGTLAAAQGVTLTEAHWKVVEFARSDFQQNGVSPNIRRITQGTGLATRDLYSLFPKAPARTVAKVAGIPKPAGCI